MTVVAEETNLNKLPDQSIKLFYYEKFKKNFKKPDEKSEWWRFNLLRSLLSATGNKKMPLGILRRTL